MSMTPRERKAALVLAGVTHRTIAEKAGKSYGYVSEVVRGTRRNEVIQQLVADAIGRPVEEVYSPRESVAA
jgi:lambda repressor-like predicted transcriptional regulator